MSVALAPARSDDLGDYLLLTQERRLPPSGRIGAMLREDDGQLEIATAHSGGHVSVYDAQGYFEPGWPQVPTDRELRGLSVYDLEGDASLEIVVTGAV